MKKKANPAERPLRVHYNEKQNVHINSLGLGYTGMPAYHQEAAPDPFVIDVELKTKEDAEKFVELLGVKYDYSSVLAESKMAAKFIWFPPLKSGERGTGSSYVWVDDAD